MTPVYSSGVNLSVYNSGVIPPGYISGS